MKKTAMQVRSLLLAAFANPGVFVVAAYAISGMFTMGKLSEVRGLLELNVLVPWGLALAMLRLYRAKERAAAWRWDVLALLMLFGWIVVPFGIRFGLNSSNINTWQNFAIIFFGVFAMMAEADEESLACTLDAAAALSAAVSYVFAGALLWCAVTVTNISTPYSEFGFGVYQHAQLCAEQHYNATGMLAMCGMFMCLMGMQRGKNKVIRLLYLLPAVMSALVVILSQSRTARYSMLAGLAVGAYGAVASLKSVKWGRKLLVRQAAGMLAGVAVLAGGYVLSSKITDAALMHYAKVQAGQKQVSLVAHAVAEEKASESQPEIVVKEARGAGDGTFTGRTLVWNNIFNFWRMKPKYFIIGNGVGRMSRDILVGTLLEHGGANMAHNAYIQFTMDLGLIGFALLCVFLALLVPPAMRVLLGAAGTTVAGGRAMCMLTVGCLVTGLMENEPLNAMRPCNVMLFFALAVIAYAGTKRKE